MTREINDAMGRSYDVPEDVDESDLMAELDALEGDFLTEDTTKGSTPSYLQVCSMPKVARFATWTNPGHVLLRVLCAVACAAVLKLLSAP